MYVYEVSYSEGGDCIEKYFATKREADAHFAGAICHWADDGSDVDLRQIKMATEHLTPKALLVAGMNREGFSNWGKSVKSGIAGGFDE